MKNSISLWYSKVLYRSPIRLFLIGLAIIIGILPGVKQLTADYSFRLLHAPENPNVINYDIYEKNFGNDDSVSVVVYSKDGIFSKRSLNIIRKLQNELLMLPGAMRVESVLEGNVISSGEDYIEIKGLLPKNKTIEDLSEEELKSLKETALGTPQIVSYLVSKDAQLGFIHLFLNPSQMLGQTEIYNFSQSVEDIVEKYKVDFKEGDIFLTGSAYLTKTLIDVSRNDQKRLAPIILIIFALIAFFTFRSFRGVFLILTIIGINVLCALGIQGYFKFPINSFTSALGIIVTIITTGAIMHVLASFYRAYNKSGNLRGALIQSFGKNLMPTFMTSFTTALGLYSLADKSLIAVFQLGVVLGTACLISWIIIYTVLGPLILLIHKQKSTYSLDANGLPVHDVEVDLHANSFSKRVISFIDNNKKKIIFVWFAAFFISIAVIPTLRVTMNPFSQFSDNIPIMQTRDIIKDKMGFSVFIEILIDSEEMDGGKRVELLRKFSAFEEEALKDTNIVKSVSLLSIIKELNQIFTDGKPESFKLPDSDEAISQYLLLFSFGDNGKLKNFLSEDGRYLKASLFSSLENSDELLEQMANLEEIGKKHGLNLSVSGKLPLYMELGLVLFKVITKSSIIAITLIGLVMFFILKNFKLTLLSLIPNVFPVLLAGGIMKILGYGIDIGSTLIFSVCLGVSIDDTIHFFYHWVKHKKDNLSHRAALEVMVLNLYPVIIATTVILGIGFGAMSFADFLPNVKFGILTAIILIFACLADLVLLPALLLLKKEGQDVK